MAIGIGATEGTQQLISTKSAGLEGRGQEDVLSNKLAATCFFLFFFAECGFSCQAHLERRCCCGLLVVRGFVDNRQTFFFITFSVCFLFFPFLWHTSEVKLLRSSGTGFVRECVGCKYTVARSVNVSVASLSLRNLLMPLRFNANILRHLAVR